MLCARTRRTVLIALASALGLGVVFSLPVLAAPEKKKAKKEPWQVERGKILTEIKQKVAAQVNKAVDPRRIAAQMKLEWPVQPPKKSPKEIEKDVEEHIQKMVDEKYPMAGKDAEYRKKAEEKYALHKIGDRVSFVIRGGRGTNTFVEGRFRAINAMRIKVSSRWIVREDMAPSDVACFDPEVHQKYVERTARVELNKYKIKRVDYAESQRRKMMEEAYHNAGYVKRGKKKWVPARTLLDSTVQDQRKRAEARIRPGMEKEIFAKKGYMLFKGEWMPKKTASSLKEKLKRMLEEKKQKSQAADLFGPDNMGGPGGKKGEMMGPGMMGPGGQKGEMMGPGMMGPGGKKGEMMGPGGMMGPEGMMGGPGGKKKQGKGGGGLFDEKQ